MDAPRRCGLAARLARSKALTLIDIEKNIAAANYHSFDGEILPNVLRFANLVVHLLFTLME